MEPLTLAELRELETFLSYRQFQKIDMIVRAVRELIALRENPTETDENLSAMTHAYKEIQASYERLRKAADAYALTEPHDDGEATYGEEYYRRLEALREALAEADQARWHRHRRGRRKRSMKQIWRWLRCALGLHNPCVTWPDYCSRCGAIRVGPPPGRRTQRR